MSNLALWDAVSKTDPAFTKQASKGAHNFTSVAPMYQNKKATEQFGVQGIGWGVVIGSEVFTEKEYGTTTILSYDAVIFFVLDGQRGEIPIHASEKSCYMTNGYKGKEGYMKIDDEVRKKVVTNAKTKGLSELGFNADVFMGEFEDRDYLEAVSNEFALEKAEDKIEEKERQQEEYDGWVNDSLELIGGCQTMNELQKLFTGMVRKANLYKDQITVVKFTKAKDKRKTELEK